MLGIILLVDMVIHQVVLVDELTSMGIYFLQGMVVQGLLHHQSQVDQLPPLMHKNMVFYMVFILH